MKQQPIEQYVVNLTYPKRLMSITELVNEMNFSRTLLMEYSRVKDAPIIRSAGGGKIFFVTSELNRFIQKIEERKRRKSRRSA